MKYQNFEAVTLLDIDAQRMLLDCGEPREKLWAAWSLGLNSDPNLKYQLQAAFDGQIL